MVKSRGVEICIINQSDVCRLPEFRYSRPPDPQYLDSADQELKHAGDQPPASTSPHYPISSCYVPINPGCQIWFEYTVEGPHPPGVAYLFKLSVNDNPVTAWDCTEKQGYHGKMMYTLVYEGQHLVTGQDIIRSRYLKFGDELDHPYQEDKSFKEDCVQINVHRIEHRQRVKGLQPDRDPATVGSQRGDGLRLADSGLLEPQIRAKRYKYQLLDPKDVPYAVFRFFCRPLGEITRSQLTPLRTSFSSGGYSDTGSSHSSNVECKENESNVAWTVDSNQANNIETFEHRNETATNSSVSASVCTVKEPQVSSPVKLAQPLKQISLAESDDNLSMQTKDSIEELVSNVPRSPQASRSPRSSKKVLDDMEEPSPSPTKSPQSRRRRKQLTVTIDGANFDLQKNKRPLSPFTGGGFLRRVIVPQTAPPSVTEFGPSVEDEIRAKIEATKSTESKEDKSTKSSGRTTSVERGGKTLMGFLGRRIAGATREKPECGMKRKT
ncbi:hypothetical protein PV10_08908 [Exophiala mesophila]|uniref:Uncharacterized protein n=1 Tax=Exophiala mesophila TaxID=212818 RepID=A0A0D1ZRC6_EXOME|nr:uncharacterized protein PV10_08908 [Exophiala mesophila]KIV89333.1 hypothetical protein PV10_08908 [Exophiala mesophila]